MDDQHFLNIKHCIRTAMSSNDLEGDDMEKFLLDVWKNREGLSVPDCMPDVVFDRINAAIDTVNAMVSSGQFGLLPSTWKYDIFMNKVGEKQIAAVSPITSGDNDSSDLSNTNAEMRGLDQAIAEAYPDREAPLGFAGNELLDLDVEGGARRRRRDVGMEDVVRRRGVDRVQIDEVADEAMIVARQLREFEEVAMRAAMPVHTLTDLGRWVDDAHRVNAFVGMVGYWVDIINVMMQGEYFLTPGDRNIIYSTTGQDRFDCLLSVIEFDHYLLRPVDVYDISTTMLCALVLGTEMPNPCVMSLISKLRFEQYDVLEPSGRSSENAARWLSTFAVHNVIAAFVYACAFTGVFPGYFRIRGDVRKFIWIYETHMRSLADGLMEHQPMEEVD